MADDELFATVDGLKELILTNIQPDWAFLSGHPRELAQRLAVLIAPFVASGEAEVEIQGIPWSSR